MRHFCPECGEELMLDISTGELFCQNCSYSSLGNDESDEDEE